MAKRVLPLMFALCLFGAAWGVPRAYAVPQASFVAKSSYEYRSSPYFADVPDMTLTVTTGASQVLIFYNSRLMTEAWHGHGQYRLVVDGNVVGDTSFESYSTSGGAHDDYNWDEYWVDYCASTMWCVSLAAGQHTIKVQWACEEGSVGTKWRRLMAVELK